MKKVLLISLILVLGLATNGYSVLYEGYLDNTETGGLSIGGVKSFGQWQASYFKLSWEVSDEVVGTETLWTYAYTLLIEKFNAAQLKQLSHVIIEVSDDNPDTEANEKFTADNIKTGTTSFGEDGGLDYYSSTSQGNSNPGMPLEIWGIKWNDLPDTDSSGNTLTYLWTIVSDRAPMWGDFYAVDGKNENNYAWNTGFGLLASAAIGNGNAMDSEYHAWLLVPDSNGGGGGGGVPEPSTLLLIGTGLLGLGLLRKR